MNKPAYLLDEHILFLDSLWSYGIRDIQPISLEYAFGLKPIEAKLIIDYYFESKQPFILKDDN